MRYEEIVHNVKPYEEIKQAVISLKKDIEASSLYQTFEAYRKEIEEGGFQVVEIIQNKENSSYGVRRAYLKLNVFQSSVPMKKKYDVAKAMEEELGIQITYSDYLKLACFSLKDEPLHNKERKSILKERLSVFKYVESLKSTLDFVVNVYNQKQTAKRKSFKTETNLDDFIKGEVFEPCDIRIVTHLDYETLSEELIFVEAVGGEGKVFSQVNAYKVGMQHVPSPLPADYYECILKEIEKMKTFLTEADWQKELDEIQPMYEKVLLSLKHLR